MGDSCIFQAGFGALFGGVFGGIVGAATTTYFPNQDALTVRRAASYAGKTSLKYAMIASTFSGVVCASESITQRKGPHNAVAGGLACGVVASLLTSNHKHGLAFGGMTAVIMGALEFSGGSLDSRQEKDFQKLVGLQLPK